MRHTGDVPIFHIALESDWTAAQQPGEYRVSTLGRSLAEVGFIHASFADQVEQTVNLVYRNVTEPLVLLVIEEKSLSSPVKIELVPAAGTSFPHVYGPIPITAVTHVLRLTRGPALGGQWTWLQAQAWQEPGRA